MRIVIALFALLVPMICQAQIQLTTTHYSLRDIMGPGDQTATGVNNLNPEQLANLEEWLNLWTVRTINQVLLMGCKCTTQDCLAALVGRNPGTTATTQQYSQQYTQPQQSPLYPDDQMQPAPIQEFRSGNPIVTQEQRDYSILSENLRNGGLLRLDDGSLWLVAPSDQTRAASWQRLDRIQVKPTPIYGTFNLFNLNRSSQVQVSRPGEAVRPGNPFLGDTFRQTHTFSIRQNVNQGEVLILDDGNAYTIKLSDKEKQARYWPPGTPVVVTRQGGLYPYMLQNSLTGDTIRAEMR